jgi:hypothetical protein
MPQKPHTFWRRHLSIWINPWRLPLQSLLFSSLSHWNHALFRDDIFSGAIGYLAV